MRNPDPSVLAPDASVLRELATARPRFAPELLSRAERWRCVERGAAGLYRWYLARSQTTRNWNPDTSFAWANVRRDHSDELRVIIEGFYAVEQYVPDYVLTLLRVIRRSYGRAQFHVRWGAEEEKHSDLWRNALLSLGVHTPASLDAYTDRLRSRVSELPWDDPIRMLFYTLFQERATQVTYANVGCALAGDPTSRLKTPADPVLHQACRAIAIDEAAHYFFFLEMSRLFLYYFPEDTLAALVDTLRHFSMPARTIIPDYERFGRTLHEAGVFGRRIHYADVVSIALKELGIADRAALEEGLRLWRTAPGPDGGPRTAALFETLQYDYVEGCVRRLFGRIGRFAETHNVTHTLDASFVEVPREFSA